MAYISNKEIKAIIKSNNKEIKALEKRNKSYKKEDYITTMKDDNKTINISKENNKSESKRRNSLNNKKRESMNNSLRKNSKLYKNNSYLSNGTPSKHCLHPKIFPQKSKICNNIIPKSSSTEKSGRYSLPNKNSDRKSVV